RHSCATRMETGHPPSMNEMSPVPDVTGSTDEPILVMRNIEKWFPGVLALSNVNLDVRAGEIHAVVGENGAGKSTLMKILAGVYRPSSGAILWRSEEVMITSPRVAQHLGIRMVFQ